MKKQTYILIITILVIFLMSFLLVQNESKIIEILPVDENMKFTLQESGVFIWLVIAPTIYLLALVGLYIPRIKKLKREITESVNKPKKNY